MFVCHEEAVWQIAEKVISGVLMKCLIGCLDLFLQIHTEILG